MPKTDFRLIVFHDIFMKLLTENIKLFAVVFLFILAFFSSGAQAQRKKPGVSKETRMNRLADQALKEIGSGQYEKALQTLEQCFALKPVSDNAFKCHLARGAAYYALRKYEEAVPDFTAAYTILPEKSILYTRGRAYFELKKYDEANRDFFRLMISAEKDKIAKEFPDLHNYRGATYTALGKYDDAIFAYKTAFESNAQSVDSYFGRAIAFELKGDFANAEKDLQKVLELDPDSKKLVNEVLERIKSRKNAAKVEPDSSVRSEKSDADFPTETDNTSALIIFAERYFNTGEYEKATETYSKIIRLEPNNAKMYYRRGTSYGNQSKNEPAVADYTKAIELNPVYAEAYLSRGATFQEIGRYDEAIRDLNKVIELDPKKDLGYIFRAKIYCKTGKKDMARADEEQAKKLGGFITEPCL